MYYRPWKLGGETWMIPWNTPDGRLPQDAYPAPDRGTDYADQKINGPFKGICGAIMLVRYTKTDVGMLCAWRTRVRTIDPDCRTI
jgi:hypothetical protein